MNAHTEPWYRTAIFYEIAMHSFKDGNGDGFGDLKGLTAELDYLAWLGVTALWLLPIFPSPMRDGGYDVADFTAVDERYGNIDDVRELLDAAHQRGIHVITDFILNHSSDQHPWFVQARDPTSAKHDWYVWSDDNDRYPDARVIFTDTYDSNWTWDDKAGAYYWHRFFDHQPDLNYENPEVRRAMLDAVSFWLDLGFDGLRLDAVPYLFEAEGTSGENLPETHAFLKEIRHLVDREYPETVLLAEANQQPEDLLPYFGDGDECHMAFHFPVMPRLFLALATGDTSPILDVLAKTPGLPAGSQWATFLRNHDELSLEMVDEEEREILLDAYAPDPAMRKNDGIRRRLAPLLDGDTRKIELVNTVLVSLPGTPVLYYGDEIGMGDDYLLDDRNGVRTPMQWSAAPSGGWSTADPTDFYLPLVTNPKYSISAVNVADQRADTTSLLHTVRRLIAERPPEFGIAPFKAISTSDVGVLGFTRGNITVFANFTAERRTTPTSATTVIAGAGSLEPGAVSLPAYGWVWLRTGDA